jgi:hypothetical protein
MRRGFVGICERFWSARNAGWREEATMAGEHCRSCRYSQKGVEGCPGLPSRADVLREAVEVVCCECRKGEPLKRDVCGDFRHHGGNWLCAATRIHALLEKEGGNDE